MELVTSSMWHFKWTNEAVRWRYTPLNRCLQVVFDQGIECLGEMFNLTLTNAYTFGNTVRNFIHVFTNYKRLLQSRQCAHVPKLTGKHW